MSVPSVQRADVEEALKEMYEAGREHHLFAFFGTGERDSVRIDPAGEIEIVPVRSELELRQLLSECEPQAKVVFLVPWRGEVPMDLRGRFVRNGAIRVIGKELRMRRLFGVERIDAAVANSALVAYLLALPAPPRLTSRQSTLSVDEMWHAWLKHEWEGRVDEEYALDSLLCWAASNARGPQWREKLQGSGGQPVLAALREHLVHKRGEAAGAVLDAWLKGQGARPLELALVCQPLLPHAQLAVWIRLRLRTELGLADEALAMKVALQLVAAVPTALRELTRGSPEAARLLLERADELVDDSEVRARLIESTYLPSAWRMRLDGLGRALLQAAQAPSVAGFHQAVLAHEQIESHERFKDEALHTVARAEMALRLLAWLVSDQSALEPFPTDPEYAPVERLGRWYVEEGGFVDWARRVARGTARSVFDRGIQAIVALADARRRELDRRFAAALPRWLLARRPANQVVPIEDVSKRLIARFLDEKPDRSLLVLLLDGMAWAQAIEILLSLEEQAEQWGPIAWHASKKGLGDAPYPVVLAALPTVTEVSRSAFFAGKLMTSGRDHATDKDAERWKENPQLTKYAAPGDWPRLLLRGEGHEAHGVASNEALSLIADRKRRVVALVINAIDSALKGDSQQWHPWTFENVRSLPAILSAARDTGRTVLLASDHGHVPCDLMETSAGPITGGARWRPLQSRDEPVAPSEIKLFGEGVWTPRSATAVALLQDDAHRYGGGAHAGEHGGATLAEVVAPCMLVRWDDPLGAQADRDLSVQKFVTPAWWYREINTSPQPQAEFKPRKPTTSPAAKSAQMALPDLLPPPVVVAEPRPPKAPSAPAPHSEPPPSVRSLASVPVIAELAKERRVRLLQALAFLLERNGLAKLDAFAAHMKLPTFRARGFVANELSPVLNVDGYQVLFCDDTHVRLDREMLQQQFEVPL